MRDFLYALAIKYQGDVVKMRKQIEKEEKLPSLKSSVPFVTIFDEAYPNVFKELDIPPLLLFYKGDISLLKDKNLIGIIGSRKMSRLAYESTVSIVESLTDQVVVSGLAYGVDRTAHVAAIDCGLKTIGIIGSGFDCLYPKEHVDLMEQCDLVISEYPLGVRAKRHHFILRNRLIAALSNPLVITSARIKSGTMHTARFALELGKDIYCVPGHMNDEDYSGCNRLINDGAYCLYDAKKQLK